MQAAPRPNPCGTLFSLAQPNEGGGGESAWPRQGVSGGVCRDESSAADVPTELSSARERERHERGTTLTGARAPPCCATRWWFEASCFSIAMNPVRWLSIYFEFITLTDSGVPSSGLTTDTGSEIATFNLVLWLTISTGMFGRPPRETGLTGRTRPSDQVFVIDPRENPTVQGMTSRKTSIKARSTAGT